MVRNQVGSPVRGNDLFGRTEFVRLVSNKLKVGNVLLAAPRRFGKTSVMYRLIDQPLWDYKVVHADLEYLTEPAQLITELVEQLARDTLLAKVVKGLSYLPKKMWSEFQQNIEEIELVKLKLKLREDIRPHWQESGDELFRRITASETTIVFILDEFPMMIDRMARSSEHRPEAKTMLRWLRALRQKPDSKNSRFLIAGSIGIAHVLNELGEISAINDFEQVRLEPFPKKVAGSFVQELANAEDLPLSPRFTKRILELIGTPVPYFIQVMFSELHKAHLYDGGPVTMKKIELVYRDRVLGVDCKTYFDHYYGRLRDYYRPDEEKAAKLLLRKLALDGSMSRESGFQLYKRAVGHKGDIEAFNHLMTDLENDFYIRFDSDARIFEFSCKLLRDWWLRHYGMDSNI